MDIFEEMQVLLPILFVVVLGIILFGAARGAGEWRRNNKEPQRSVPSRIVSKRTQVRFHHHHDDGMSHHHSDTIYYATFEVESGNRLEFKVSGKEYGQLAEGDYGHLNYQGTRYKGFERQPAGGLRRVSRG
ncbi:DUF2500 domain-containing protein [Cohnella sp. REN36]|uniref:DUF2500 domain-containing protein n=1 Tax=Cohnella sp. REN36 TaxID=2887347 RepID=UPI001D136B09|nr:DUF2500 domain-containing protein [Cohnella sp. REN36]MCC3376474.1 DUF2500 domain-containing protein [Cohnella sp. REN36]